MRTKVPHVLEAGRVRESDPALRTSPGEWYGRFIVRCPATGATLLLVVSAGDPEEWAACGFAPPAWEHVSVSVRDPNGPRSVERCPTWEEMAWVKGLCWGPDECVVQFHPPESDYVNWHAFVLHLWKPVGVDVPRPPSLAVGPKADEWAALTASARGEGTST